VGYSYTSLLKLMEDNRLFAGKRVVTLGTLYPFVSARQKARLVRRGLNFNAPQQEFSNRLFTDILGAELCHSLDVSNYQGAEIICNLNFSIPERYAETYDVVVDAGTLEHVSNLSTAIENIFRLLRKSGIYYFGVPSNNWVDHGFFQFSPTFFRDLCIDNPNLELLELHVGTNKKYYDYNTQNPAFIQALLHSRHRLNVGGIIRKTGDGLNLNLTQSKYRHVHAFAQGFVSERKRPVDSDSSSGPLMNTERGTASALVHRFGRSPWIPLAAKEVILNALYRFRGPRP
jgi:hypothetical protein